jgi:serine/threonine-protein kinase
MNIAKRFGRYEIQSELGRGGMAVVYHAFDPKSGREVALKVLPRQMTHDPQFRSRFEHEVKMVAGLEHASIVPVYDVGEEDEQPYFVMRYMPGGSLAQRIAKGRLSLAETARIIEKVAIALAYAHQKGVIHRDLKPDNILFDDHNEPFISDFGIAKLFGGGTGSLTNKEYVGTPAYMSPEQSQGEKMDKRSDVYSLGAVIFEMLTGEKPYSAGTPMGVALKHITQPVPKILRVLASLPNEVDTLIKTAMAKKKEDRYASAIELAKALNLAAFGHEGNLSGNLSIPHVGRSFSNIKTGLIVTSIILVVAVAGFFVLRNQLFSSTSPAPSSPISSPEVATTIPPPTFTDLPSIIMPTETESATFTPAPSTTTAATATEVPASTVTESSFAPACPAGIVVPTPALVDIDKFCAKKTPYTTLSIPMGATFESLRPGFSCKVEFTRNGRSTLSCTGTPLYSFNLKVCQPLTVDAIKCQPGSNFEPANQCCTAALPEGTGCTIYKVDIRACP